ncbi:inactive histone-lysine N-methyltransferase 2E-like isoform X2 [Mya arenaria]|uniref:inactive histone-lysine N-methyltransferase 2E-like isoform X2 n=1 Tax=Mya arenaria TaxID=6604 RepID=UPI0022E875EA|nr:inactive histone-lysine N-methyltransferase 2E-like isoform X2 [Mya arenaria]
MSVLMRYGGVTEPSYIARPVAEDTEYEGPVDMSMSAEEAFSSPSQTYPGCFGLPYQDHNYGAPPPPTPPQTPPLIAAPIKPATENSVEVKEEIVVTSDTPILTRPPPSPQPESELEDTDDPTRCICDFVHDDGYMIQCDQCSVWQHIVCMGLDRDSIPDTYHCEVCKPRPVDRARAREFQIRKREFLKTLVVKPHDSSTDTCPEEVNNRLKAYGLDQGAAKQKQKMKLKKRKERSKSMPIKRLKSKELKPEKENASNEANRKAKLLVKDFSSKSAQARKEKLSKKIERMRAERLSKEMLDDKFSSDDLRDDDKIINTMSSPPLNEEENAQDPWDMEHFNEWEQSYETARYNQYTTYVQEYLNSTCVNGHHNDIADLVTDGLRVQRCQLKELKHKRKGLEASCKIPNGQPIIEVIGKVMTRHQYDKDNFGQRQLSPFVFFYGTVFDLDLVIDASDYGNDARFIRRSCQPNAAVHHVVAGGQAHFITVATREIPEGTEITIPFDYDYKKWNFCVECACLRNNCPVTRYQKRRLRFQKLQQQQHGGSPLKKYHKPGDKLPKLTIKSPVKPHPKSPVKSPVKSPEKPTPEVITATAEAISVSQLAASPIKMLRRSQVTKAGSHGSSHGRVRSLRVPSQNKVDPSVASDLISVSETSSMRSSEADILTSPESTGRDPTIKQEEASDQPKSEKKRKMTREERKMEAIMKAFEKMEKRTARKTSVDTYKGGKGPSDRIKTERDEKDFKRDIKKETDSESEPESKQEVKTEVDVTSPAEKLSPVKVEKPLEYSPEKNVKVEGEPMETKEDVKPTLRERPPATKGKKTKKSGRRRARNMSGAGSISMDTPAESQEENSNHAYHLQPVSCPVTPAIMDMAADVPPAFRFLKTKRHLMNEWLSEKSESKPVGKSEPLEVSVDESMFVTCLPSPRNSMDRLRRNSASAGVRERSVSLNVETTAGSAKKRWLRQAMGEGSEVTANSPVPGSGCQSPNSAAMPSPGGSPPIDFVTPLKKRRLARESMSHDSISLESPAQTPTPTASATSTGYFASLSESFENFKSRNGFNMLFSPLKPVETDTRPEEKSEPMEFNVKEVQCDTGEVVEVAPPETSREEGLATQSCEKDVVCSVSSCGADMDSSVNITGTSGNECSGSLISTAEAKSSEDSVVASEQADNSDQTNVVVCDQNLKSASNSEPDSSDSAHVGVEESHVDVECDSGTSNQVPMVQGSSEMIAETVEPSLAGEVDSSESSSARVATEISSTPHVPAVENNQCDSCNSERRDSLNSDNTSSSFLPDPSNVSDKLCSSSSVLSTTFTHDSVNDSAHVQRNTLPCVDSSTDDAQTQSESVSSGSVLPEAVLLLSPSRSLLADNIASHSTSDSEVSNSMCVDNLQSNFTSPLPGRNVGGLSDSFSVSSNVSTTPGLNRHLKFLHDSSYSADTTVDSTTQYIPNIGAPNLMHSPAFPATVGYDSDSMDVTSASEPGYSAMMEDGQQTSDDLMTIYTESLSSTCPESSQPPKEKKKVSLQEYLKRKKEKTSTSTTSPSTSSGVSEPPPTAPPLSTVSSTTTTSPLKLSTPITLEILERKLPPLPSLPSLPMFEKTERKEFKSSSDLLSPIFNRREKQEEVRKPMSLSERLRQEFGLDDATDTDTDTEAKIDLSSKAESNERDAPPPPPPPPPQSVTRPLRMTNGAPTISPIIKPFSSSKPGPPLSTATKPGDMLTQLGVSPVTPIAPGSAMPLMVPPSGPIPPQTIKPLPGTKSSPNLTGLAASKSPIHGSLSTLLSNVKTPQQIQNDLTVQLAAIKAQLNKVQQAQQHQGMPSSSSSNNSSNNHTSVVEPLAMNSVNGVTPSTKPQVFEYGHQSSSGFPRQNSFPGASIAAQITSSATNGKPFQAAKMNSPSLGSRLSPGFSKVSPNGSSSLNNHRDRSPSWNHKLSNSSHSSQQQQQQSRKPFGKQLSHKY